MRPAHYVRTELPGEFIGDRRARRDSVAGYLPRPAVNWLHEET